MMIVLVIVTSNHGGNALLNHVDHSHPDSLESYSHLRRALRRFLCWRVHHLAEHPLLLHLLVPYGVAKYQNLRSVTGKAHQAGMSCRLTSHSEALFKFFIVSMSTQVTTSFPSMTKRSFKVRTTRPESALTQNIS
jgi:hypothetical protein